jgi:hypothetical protein
MGIRAAAAASSQHHLAGVYMYLWYSISLHTCIWSDWATQTLFLSTLFPDSSSACYCIDPSIFSSPHPPFLVLSVCLKVISIDSIYLVLLYTSSSSPTQTHLPEYHTVESISFLSELFFLPPPAWPTRRLYLFGFEKQMGAGVKKDRADSLMQSADETRLHCVLPLCDGCWQQRCWCWSVVESHNSWASCSLCIRLFWHSELRRRRSAWLE